MEQVNSLFNGTIVKGIGGFYYVETSGHVYECKAKGLFRKDRITPMVGDSVLIKLGTGGEENVIKEILPRRNQFVRPPVANVEVSLVVAAVAEPEPVFQVIDKLIIMAEKKETDVVLAFNKRDLASEAALEAIRKIYVNTGYPVYFVSTRTGEGIGELKEAIKGRITMLAGASGVGKSSLVNAMEEFGMETGELSRKTGRGKHTTRHAELLTGEGGIRVFDTPGFTSFDVLDMQPEEVRDYFPEFEEPMDGCRFTSCMHLAEPDCGVKAAVEKGEISAGRYESYVRIYNELKEKCKRF